ncbi:MAG TPA: superoxide dismutase [Chthoniobacteraceae bacterium]|jgi:Fe-Mn family superoxide dismutase
MITRRSALRNLALGTGALVLTGPALLAQAPTPAAPAGDAVFKLPPLGYDYDALEPFIDAETMKLHHDKHHAAYVAKLNEAIAKAPGWEKRSIEDILAKLPEAPEEVRSALRNHGGGHANHSLFWQTLKKNENGKPAGELAKAIDQSFGSLEKFQEKLIASATGIFGSGWAWLLVKGGKLSVETTANQDSPYSSGATPLLGLDVWEHAYYLKYQNRRPEYAKAFLNVINWDFVSAQYAASMKA